MEKDRQKHRGDFSEIRFVSALEFDRAGLFHGGSFAQTYYRNLAEQLHCGNVSFFTENQLVIETRKHSKKLDSLSGKAFLTSA